jgi:hypothetical protein
MYRCPLLRGGRVSYAATTPQAACAAAAVVFRYRIGAGENAEHGAWDRHSASGYDAKTNTIRIMRRELPDPPTRVEPPRSLQPPARPARAEPAARNIARR